MANLSTKKWVRYEPSIPGNAELPPGERFYLEVCAGLTTPELEQVRVVLFDQWRAAIEAGQDPSELVASALEGRVRFGSVPLTLDGEPVRAMAPYLKAITATPAVPLLRELIDCVLHNNSWEGLRALFYVRPFGGGVGTGSTKTELGANQPAAR